MNQVVEESLNYINDSIILDIHAMGKEVIDMINVDVNML